MGKLLGLQKTGYMADTPEKYLIDAATLYKNLAYDAISGTYTGELVGATNGGVEIDITQKYRDVEVDGTYWTAVKGNKALSSTEVVAKTSIKEFTAETLRLSINGTSRTVSDVNEAPKGYEIVEGKRYVEAEDYINNLAVVGKISGSNRPIIFMLDNCLATAGAKIKTEDDKEAEIPVEFTAHADYDQLSNDVLPYRIIFPTSADVLLTSIDLKIDGLAPSAKLTEGQSYHITATPVPAEANLSDLLYATVDHAVATIDQSGNIKAVKAGTTDVLVLTKDGEVTATLEITVEAAKPVTAITATPATKAIKVGDSGVIGLDSASNIKLAVTPTAATGYALSFEANNSFATVDAATGHYEAMGAGTTVVTITATNLDGTIKTATVTFKITTH